MPLRWRSILSEPRFVGRAAVGFGLVTAITVLTAITSALYARDASARREQMLTAYATDLTNAYRAQLAAEKMVAVGRGYLLDANPNGRVRFRDAETQLDRSLDALDHAAASAHERELLAQAKGSAVHYRTMFDDIIESGDRPGPTRTESLRDKLIPAREELGARLEELVDHKRALQDAATRRARRIDVSTFVFMASIGIGGAILSVLLAWGFTKHLGHMYRREQDAAARANAAAAAKEELLGTVAHDLRNPLGAIILKATLLGKRTEDARARSHAESIAAIATRAEVFIQRLLDAASIEAGRLSVAWKRCVVADLLANTMETFGALAAQKAVTLEQEMGRGDLAVWGDPERIGQVLANLVGNALKFTPEGGQVTIRAVESGFHTRIEVRDTGPGIASQHLPRIFDRFWKADAEGRQGTGLGLYIAKGIIEKHRGRIWAESLVGVGSAFIFELPIAPPSEAEAEPVPVAPDERRPADSETMQGGAVGEHPHR
ncbi:MAG TPA: ATP-binding protein [Polyangia bacterium]|jgi:signal transduction histidine kinase|nr:ATP-binding protein [Polyangia bacterium]